MKAKWLIILLLFSLAINGGIIGTIIYHHVLGGKQYRHQNNFLVRAVFGLKVRNKLNLSQEQNQALKQIRVNARNEISEIREELYQARNELLTALAETEVEQEQIEKHLGNISNLQDQWHEKVVENVLQAKDKLTPEQQKIFMKSIKQRIQACVGSQEK
ncbi:periplasmic heavy metal sensor [bacterium]|nr:periplasmic heavy metal sensor [bacterium]